MTHDISRHVNRWVRLAILFAIPLILVLLSATGPAGDPYAMIILIIALGYGFMRITYECTQLPAHPGIVMFWLYGIFIFLVPALSQLSHDRFFWDDWGGYSPETQIKAALISLMGLVFTDFFYMRLRRPLPPSPHNAFIPESPTTLIIPTVIGALLTLALLLTYGSDFFIRSRGALETDLSASVSNVEKGLTITLAATFLVALLITTSRYLPLSLTGKDKFLGWTIFIAVSSMNAVINFPGRLARFALLGTILAAFTSWLTAKNLHRRSLTPLVVAFPAALYVLFRFLGAYNRDASFSFDQALTDTLDFQKTLLFGDFGCYQMTMIAVRYVETNGLTWGNQILSGLLFFIPRSTWPSKAEPTGVTLAANEGYNFTNLSSPLFVEGYIDLGYVGLIATTFVIGWLIAKADHSYLHPNPNRPANTLISIIFIALLPVIIRGSLLGISAYIVSVMFFLYLLNRHVSSGSNTNDGP